MLHVAGTPLPRQSVCGLLGCVTRNHNKNNNHNTNTNTNSSSNNNNNHNTNSNNTDNSNNNNNNNNNNSNTTSNNNINHSIPLSPFKLAQLFFNDVTNGNCVSQCALNPSVPNTQQLRPLGHMSDSFPRCTVPSAELRSPPCGWPHDLHTTCLGTNC